jgi:tRNA (cmo5U34)-methyltransferase
MKVGNDIQHDSGKWSFSDEETVKKFDGHIKQSIPLYETAHELVVSMVNHFLQEDAQILEIGTSTGALAYKIAKKYESNNVKVKGIDIAENMISYAQKYRFHPNISYELDDIRVSSDSKYDVVISMYTLQFVPPKYRQNVVNNIYNCLEWGGGFFFFEKVRGSDARFQDLLTTYYLNWKLENDFNHEEVLGKMISLEGILEPFSTAGNLGLLERAGFSDVQTIFKIGPFEGLLAIK